MHNQWAKRSRRKWMRGFEWRRGRRRRKWRYWKTHCPLDSRMGRRTEKRIQ